MTDEQPGYWKERALAAETRLTEGLFQTRPQPQPSSDLVEVVARLIAPHLEGGRKFDRMPCDRRDLRKWCREGIALANDATQDDAREVAELVIPLVQQAERADVVAIIAKHGVASCNCLTTTPKAAFHLETCPYQRIALILDEIDERWRTQAGEPAMTITDADRQAAAECLPIVDEEWIEHERGLMRAGEMDGHPLVQAFARHRVNAINSIRGGDDGL